MELEIEKAFSDIKISGEFYGNEFEKVQKIIEPARKILDIMEDNFGAIYCEIMIKENKVRVYIYNIENVLDVKFKLELSKNSLTIYPETNKSEDILGYIGWYVNEIHKNL
jgi:hypothetical protein